MSVAVKGRDVHDQVIDFVIQQLGRLNIGCSVSSSRRELDNLTSDHAKSLLRLFDELTPKLRELVRIRNEQSSSWRKNHV